MATEKVLEVKNLVVSFKTDRGIVKAVRGVSFDLHKGETLCIVGESGSGKSVTNKAIMGISAKNAIIENGAILYEGEDLTRVSEEEFHRIRGHKIGMIFQDPLSALNPVMRIGKQIIEATMINKNILKRKFAELVSKELTLYRNNEADYNYNISKLRREYETNEKLVESYKNATSVLSKLQRSLQNANEEKEAALKNEIASVEEKINGFKEKYDEYVNSWKKNITGNIELYSQSIKENENKTEENELLKTIRNNSIEKDKRILEFISSPSYLPFTDDLLSSLAQRNKVIDELCAIFKEEFKKANPALKENFKLAKERAKKEVAEYKAEIDGIHHQNIANLTKKVEELNAKLFNVRTTLSDEQKMEVDKVIAFNNILKKKKARDAKKFRETSISKTVKVSEEFKVVPVKEYADVLDEIEAVNKEIERENEDYISKTVITKAQAKKMAIDVMREVGIPMPERRFKQYPFEFSGGMRQRIVIAIALTANPEILICDEPTTALDVTIQAQILELINKLKQERNLSCIFITHDLGVVANMADRVAVMYAGKIVEYGTSDEIFFEPKHPYTWALLSSIPDVDSKEKLEAIPGTPPDMIYPPKGDAFALRSKYAMEIDFKAEPPYFKLSDTHYAATWLLHPDAPKVEMPKIVAERIKNATKSASKGGK